MSDYLETWLDSESAGQNVIAVKTIYIDINDGCLTDGFLFSQIVYWSGKNKEGQYRARVFVNGERWIVKEADEWFSECRIKDSTARASLDRIVRRGLIIKEVHRFKGKASTHIRINPEVFEARIKLALQDLPMPRIAENKQSGNDNPGLPKSSKAGLPKSSNVYTETNGSDTQEELSTNVDNSAETATPLSADIPSEQSVKAKLPHLNVDERKAMKHLLQAVQTGKVIESMYSPKIVTYLIELGEIERCQFGLYQGLCLKGKSAEPLTECKTTPDQPTRADEKVDPAINAVQAMIAGLVQPDNEIRVDPDRPTRDAADQPTWRRAVASSSGNGQSPTNNPPTPPPAKATAPKAGRKKAGKPAIYSDKKLFDLIADFMGIAGDAEIRASAPQIGKARKALCDYILDKLQREPTPDELGKIYQRLEGIGAWYDQTCKGCDRPGWDKVTKWYIRNLQATNGTAQGSGDGCFFDNGWFKRENGVLYRQNERNSEQWEVVK